MDHNEKLSTSIIALTQKLISLYSIDRNTSALKKIVELIHMQLPEFTFESFVSNEKPSLLIHNADLGTKHFKIILNAHLDVVPGRENQFTPQIVDNKLFGRGAYDMKAAAAVMIVLFKKLAKQIAYPLALQIVTDEEMGGHNGTEYQIKKGITADFVITGENTNGVIRNKSKSPLWIKIYTQGKASHAAYPWVGENAIEKMIKILNKLKQLYPNPTESEWKTTISVAKIETSNDTFNRIPDDCTAWIDVRVIPEEENEILETIKKILPERSDITLIVQEKSAYTDPHNPFIIKLQQAIKKICDEEGKISGANGASDIHFFNEKHIPGVEFGPKGDNPHADNEWVDIKSLEEYYSILEEFLFSN